MDFWTTTLEFAQAITTQVGAQLLADFGHAHAIEKRDGSLVTQSDQWADQALRTAIAQTFPEHGVLSEEVEHIFPANDWCWVIDPIDGTTNFARGIPLWAISLGLLYRGTPVFGYVYLPPLNQAFYGWWYGETGLSGPIGAFLNDKPIQVSQDALSRNHFFSVCARSISALRHPFPCKIRMLGVATYNLLNIATGAVLGGVEATPKIWDIAGIWPIVQAAGATWHALDNQAIFPLQVGQDYGDRAFPTLVVSRPEFISVLRSSGIDTLTNAVNAPAR